MLGNVQDECLQAKGVVHFGVWRPTYMRQLQAHSRSEERRYVQNLLPYCNSSSPSS
jgi:hypothetical protein